MSDPVPGSEPNGASNGSNESKGADGAKKLRQNPIPFRLVTRADEVFELKKDWPSSPVPGGQIVDCTIEAIFDFSDEFEEIDGHRVMIEEAHWEIVGLPRVMVPCDHKDPRACRVSPQNREELVNPAIKDGRVAPEFEGLPVHIDPKTNRGVRFGTFFLNSAGVIAKIPNVDVRRVEYRQNLEDLKKFLDEEQADRYLEPPEEEEKAGADAPAADAPPEAPSLFQPPAGT